MLDLLKNMFGGHASKDVAKERLRLVLIHDRNSVSPKLIESLRTDLMKVISEYLEIDHDGLDVDLQTTDTQVALVANIPVKRIKRSWQA